MPVVLGVSLSRLIDEPQFFGPLAVHRQRWPRKIQKINEPLANRFADAFTYCANTEPGKDLF